MPDRKIRNISKLMHPLPVHVRSNNAGKDVVVQLAKNEEFWCPNSLDTNSLTVYSRKGYLIFTNEEKPDGAVYYESYPVDHWAKTEEPIITEKIVSEDMPVVTQRVKWEEEDIAFLKKNYPKKGVTYCAEKLGRQKHAVKKKVEALGLKREDDKE